MTIEEFKQSLAIIEDRRKAIRKEFEALFAQLAADFLALAPTVRGFTWTQYAPYFNDGDTCEFSVHEMYLLANEPAEDEDDDGEGFDPDDDDVYEDQVKPNTLSPEAQAAWKFITSLENEEEFMREAFGTDTRVIVTRDGVEATEYDHE
jgi:hypothetical protein